MKEKLNIFWFRRDLRLNDNAGLYHALSQGNLSVLPIFIFDKNILDHLPPKDARVEFLHNRLGQMSEELEQLGSTIKVFYGKPEEIWSQIIESFNVDTVYTNHDHEPYALERDQQVHELLSTKGITFKTYKDHVLFEKDEVLKDDGKPYTVFTPYKRKWYEKLNSKIENGISFYLKPYPTEQYFHKFVKAPQEALPTLESMGFNHTEIVIPSTVVPQKIIQEYDQKRDFPAINGTSMLGIHFRFGTISIRDKALKALSINTTYLNELIWRDFYSMILAHFPHVVNNAFRPEYDQIQWVNNEAHFEAWKNGKTGYPIVDAGMRQLNATGYM
nr:deoxyribodipyrimidine photo-lyase [Saprospiraceae bacterium]